MGEQKKARPRPNFAPVNTTFKIRGGANRGDAATTVFPSGRIVYNASAADQLKALIEQVTEQDQLQTAAIKFQADKESKLVGGFVVAPGTSGAMPITRNKDGSYSCHMGGVFEEYPSLRLDVKSTVLTDLVLDEDPPYQLYNLQIATGIKRKGGTSDPAQPGTQETTTKATATQKGGKGKQSTTPPTTTQTTTSPAPQATAPPAEQGAAAADENKNPQE